MSTILKALRRLEDEKERVAARPLREQVVLARARSRRRAAWWALAVAGALAFAISFAALRSLRGGAPPETEPPPVAAAPGAEPAPEPAMASAAPPFEAPPAAVAAPAPSAPIPADSPLAAPAPEGEWAAEAEPDVAVVRPPGRAPRIADEPVAAVVRPSLPSRSERAPARPEAPIRVVRTSWHPLPARRAAWVEWAGEGVREVREGGRVGPYRVREIEPDGVLFADGAELLRKSIASR